MHLSRLLGFGGHPGRKARANAADALDAADVFLYRDSSIAPLLDMRRRFKAVMDVLGAMIQHGVSLARWVELTAQWNRILAAGPLYPATLDDLHDFHRVVSDVDHRLDEAIREWRNWLREDTMVHPKKWLRPDLVSPCSLSSVQARSYARRFWGAC